MRSWVSDVYNITPSHFLNAGVAGCRHFHLLLKALLDDVENTTIDEVNTAYACILFKGHSKDRTSSRSYRTISTWPVIAKALDLYIHDLYKFYWNSDKADTQYQGEGRLHELAALLLTESILHSVLTLKEPAYVLYLDARSTFDVVLRELLIKNIYGIQPLDQSLLYLDNRLRCRKTFVLLNFIVFVLYNFDFTSFHSGNSRSHIILDVT